MLGYTHTGYLSSDLLMDHPVGNMMRAVLPLHDLSRMDVTVFLVRECTLMV
jgi:predicted O-linked N-acetylglucosamine transferase (SPINDLY family)